MSPSPRAVVPRVVVIGAGALGGWSALELRRRGAEVTLVDAFGPGNPRSSSGGETRIIRAVYGASRLDTELAARALERWRVALGPDGEGLLHPTGLLWLVPHGSDNSYLVAAAPHLAAVGLELEPLGHTELARRVPHLEIADLEHAYLEPGAGVLLAREACRRVARVFEREGGCLLRGHATGEVVRRGEELVVALSDGRELVADQVVFACGPWLPKLFPELLGRLIVPSRQDVVFVGTPPGDSRFEPESMPAWIELGPEIVYGLPSIDGRGAKVAEDTRGVPVDPDSLERVPDPQAVERMRRALGRRFPALAGAPVVETRVCQYENSPDGELIVDRHPELAGVWIVGGGSGHAFKLGPAIGELVAAAVLESGPLPHELALGRFGDHAAEGGRRTQFERAAGR